MPLKTKAYQWDSNIPLTFPQTDNISTKPNAPPNEVLVWNGHKLTNKYLRTIDEKQRDEIAKDLLNYFSGYDLSNLKPDDKDVLKDWENLKKLNVLTTNGIISNKASTGNKIVRRFFQNLFEVKSSDRPRSVFDVVKNRARLWKIIRNRVGNTLIFCDAATGSVKQVKGVKKCCDECPGTGERHQYPMSITSRMVLIQGVRASGESHTASIFKAGVAKAIYSKYVKDGDKVLDFSCGFGTRMLGLFSAGKKDVSYFGYEPCAATYNGLHETAKFFGFADRINIKKCGSEEETFGENTMDFSFSSPPYFTAELYSSDISDHQCYNLYSKYEDWLEKYWRKTVKNLRSTLKPGAMLGLNVGNSANAFMERIKNDMTRIVEEEGFELSEKIEMSTPRSHLTKKINTGVYSKMEPIFFYRNTK